MQRMTAAGRLGGPPLIFLNGTPAVCALLERNNSKAGIVGLEYIVEIVGKPRHDPVLTYECVLCARPLLSKGGVVHHVMQNVHKIAYLAKHFPLSLEPVLPYMRLDNRNTWQFRHPGARVAIRHICSRIEHRFGRQNPAMIRFDAYKRHKELYDRKVADGLHFVEDCPVPLDGVFKPFAQHSADGEGGGEFVDDDGGEYMDDEGEFALQDDGGEQQHHPGWGGMEGGGEEGYHQPQYDEAESNYRQYDGELNSPRRAYHRERSAGPRLNVVVTTDYKSIGPVTTVKASAPSHKAKHQPHQQQQQQQQHPRPIVAKSASPPAIVRIPGEDVFITYERQLHKVSVELQAKLLRYETAPEQHPLYPTEWKTFWLRRSSELKAEGKDTDTYDFSADWTRFWLVRVQELNEEELKRSDRAIRRKLDLPLEGPIAAAPVAAKPAAISEQAVVKSNALPATSSAATKANTSAKSTTDNPFRSSNPAQKHPLADIASSGIPVAGTEKAAASSAANRSQSRERRQRDVQRPRDTESPSRSISDRDRSPLQKSRNNGRPTDYAQRAAGGLQRAAGSRSVGNAEPVSDNDDDNLKEEPVTVISVLRLLSAFEDLLGGSLGPRVVDLLSKAVALEKVKANLADDLLMSADNSVLLTTVKEKLKGLLLAGVVESFKVRSVRRVIANVNSITRIIDTQTKLQEERSMAEARACLERKQEAERVEGEVRRKREEEQRRRDEAERKVREEADARALVMKQVATSITLQGKRITKDQLEALTDVYIKNHTANDTPYLFGLQMGSRFPPLNEEEQQSGSQESHMGGEIGGGPDTHPMHWNAHHQPPPNSALALAAEQQARSWAGEYGHGQGQQQQQPQNHQQQQQQNHQHQQQQQQQQQQNQPYNSYGYYNNAGYQQEQQQQPQQQQQHSAQNQRPNLASNPFRGQFADEKNAGNGHDQRDRDAVRRQRTGGNGKGEHGGNRGQSYGGGGGSSGGGSGNRSGYY